MHIAGNNAQSMHAPRLWETMSPWLDTLIPPFLINYSWFIPSKPWPIFSLDVLAYHSVRKCVHSNHVWFLMWSDNPAKEIVLMEWCKACDNPLRFCAIVLPVIKLKNKSCSLLAQKLTQTDFWASVCSSPRAGSRFAQFVKFMLPWWLNGLTASMVLCLSWQQICEL